MMTNSGPAPASPSRAAAALGATRMVSSCTSVPRLASAKANVAKNRSVAVIVMIKSFMAFLWLGAWQDRPLTKNESGQDAVAKQSAFISRCLDFVFNAYRLVLVFPTGQAESAAGRHLIGWLTGHAAWVR